ncbi:hypothetical protein DH2020_041458 [Rehmannia glutinosa]|uniref:Uncharacterized protein n=1 Tax=Rehmannia glutinosa TaxID=99300 RepID=A0ABR0UR99_REHGL
MATENEPAKLLLPYLQRADELQKHEPLVAYYCRLYAMERGLKIPQSDRTKTTNALLDKKSLKLGPDDHLHVEGFALNVFARADKQDRAGRADLNTAKTFYAASIFFEILNQFGELQPDLEQKQKYAVWKAAEIRKALKEGRKPVPGPPGGDKDLSVPASPSSGEYDLEPKRNDFTDFAPRPEHTRVDPAAETAPDSDSSPQPYDQDNNFQHSTNFSRQPSNLTPSPSSTTSPPSHYPTDNYPSDSLHQPPSANNSEHSIYHQPYHHQPYQPEPPQHYPSHDGSDAFYANSSPSNTAAAYASTPQYSSNGRNGSSVSEIPTTTQKYEYDSNYQPPPEKIAEAHKAARFAVGALAFDDVSIAIISLHKARAGHIS